ncbi:MAG: hypothetical protein GC181_10415 [Bacteroidetes bacterium]|nr:hypothetical protein [Bacteroidota bacterium]
MEYAQKPPLTDTICSNDALRAQTEIMAGRLSFIYNGDYRFGLPQEVRKLCDSMKLSFKSSGYNDIISNQMRWCYEVLMDAALTDTFGHEFKEKLIARAKENLKDSFKFSETFYLGSACEIPTKLHYRKEFSDQLYNLITDDTSFQNEWGIPINADLYIQKTGEVRNINIREEYLPKALVEKIKDLVYRYIMMDYRYWQAGSIFGVPVNTVITVNFTIVYKEL